MAVTKKAPKKGLNYDLKASANAEFPAPKIDYQPRKPKKYRPRIALIGCGGIVEHHLRAYQADGYSVVAFCDALIDKAEERRNQFFPDADVTTDASEIFSRKDIDVVDIATHPKVRETLIRDALKAGKHVLSQKPFVHDLGVGRELVKLADKKKLRLAVNQNGRWAPYFCWMRKAVEAGYLGDVCTVDITMNWDHSWIKGSAFESIHHVVLYDFAIHWFDMAVQFFGERSAKSVFANAAPAKGQDIKPPMLAHAAVEMDGGLATLSFNALSRFGAEERITVAGTEGTLHAFGPGCAANNVTLHTKKGVARPDLTGAWFPDGFRGTMGELLCAIEEDREPENSARQNLRSLAVCFGALASADSGEIKKLGKSGQSR